MKLLEKLQKLDETKKKMILWTVAIVLGICFIFIWYKLTIWRLKGISVDQIKETITLPNIQIPEIEMPTFPDQLQEEIISQTLN